MHSVAITPAGMVYSWGCNDEGALGRKGKEDKPLLVPLPIRADGAACGDSHTVIWNTKQSRSFLTGLYRVSRLASVTEYCTEFDARGSIEASADSNRIWRGNFQERKAYSKQNCFRCTSLPGINLRWQSLGMGRCREWQDWTLLENKE